MSLANKSWWCWLVLAGTFYISFVVDGYNFAFGIIKLDIEHEYHGIVSKEWVSVIGALVPALYCLLAPVMFGFVAVFSVKTLTICGALLSTFGFLLAYANYYLQWGFILDLISIGVIQGVAAGMLYGPSINMIPTYFRPDRKALSTGITTCGSPAGAIAYGFLMHILIANFGWRGSMLFWAAFAAIVTLAGFTFLEKGEDKKEDENVPLSPLPKKPETEPLEKPEPSRKDEIRQDEPLLEPGKKEKVEPVKKSTKQRLREEFSHIFSRELFSEWRFIALIFGMAFSILGYFVPTLLVTGQSKEPEYDVSIGVQENLIVLWGLASLVGRLTVGFLADLGRITRLCASLPLFLMGLGVSAACLLVFPHVMIYGDIAFVGMVLVYGFFSAPFITLRSTIFQDLYYTRKEQVASSFGWALFSEGCVIIAAFALPTMLNELGAVWAYVFGAACFCMSGLLLSISLPHFFEMYKKKVEDMNRNGKYQCCSCC